MLCLVLTSLGTAMAAETLYVYADGKYYPHCYYSMNVAQGYTADLPVVTDADGNTVSVTWKITWQAAGLGNPESTSFKLSGNRIKCTWAYGSCEVTATAKSGAKIRINVSGYRLAKKIRFQESEYTVKEGHQVQTEVTIVESGYLPGPITWQVGDTSIIAFTEEWPSTGRPTVTGLKPGTTTLTAILMNGVRATCTITVESVRLPGDANESGGVTLSDGEDVLRYVAGETLSINHINADVNADGVIDIHDALLILQHVAGWNVELK